jgi:hypothetical protein
VVEEYTWFGSDKLHFYLTCEIDVPISKHLVTSSMSRQSITGETQ